MATDALEIRISDNASEAAVGLEKLTATLNGLKAATANNAGLKKIQTSLEGMSTALSGLNKVNIALFTKKLAELPAALAPLENLGKNNLSSFVNSLKKIPDLTVSLNVAQTNAFADAINRVAAAVRPLATEMEKIAMGFSAMPKRIQSFITQMDRSGKGATTAAKGYRTAANALTLLNQKFNLTALYFGMRRIADVLGGFVQSSNDYIENMNLFTVSMGEFADEAYSYAQKAQELMGIDAGQFMRNQGFFMSIASGFGMAGEQASVLSKNLAQLGYDLASFYNSDIDTAMQKLQSGLAGELEPLRRWGFALDQATLQQVAYAHGINMSIREMNQAQKAQIRYIAIMEQSVNAQHDMARTLTTPANAMRIFNQQITLLSRSIGNILIPVLMKVLPYVLAFVKVLRMAADALALFLFGETLTIDIDYDSFGDMSVGVDDAAGSVGELEDNLGGAAKEAKKLLYLIGGFDELNVLPSQNDPTSGSGGGSGVGGVGGSGFEGLELPEYDFLAGIDEQIDALIPKIKEFLTEVAAVGAAFLALTIAKGVLDAIELMQSLKSKGVDYSIGFKIAGAGLFLDAWNTMKEAIQDIMENGPNFTNVTKLLSGFAEALGASFLLLGNIKFGGAALAISGLLGIVSDVSDMIKHGVNWENATSLAKNAGLFVAGLAFYFGNLKLGGIGLIISGVALLVENFHAIVKGFTTDDWSDVEWIEVAAGALLTIGGLIIAIKKMSAVADVASLAGASKSVQTVTATTQSLSKATGTLSPALSSLAKNLGFGLIIIAEVAAAAILIVGAIWVLGKELEQVGIAWQPVIDNGATIAIAVGLGAAVLGVIGVATALLGSFGAPLALNMAIGIAILAELGVAAGLFILEIWAIGKGLDEIGKAWQPVLDNGDTIAKGIGLGTALLVGIGVVTAALGVATVASAGALPLAIGLGTAILIELSIAFVLFTKSLVEVADTLAYELSPALARLNEKLPDLSTNMRNFVSFMIEFAEEVVAYTAANTIANLSATIDTIVGWFTADALDKLVDDVDKTYEHAYDLKDKLKLAVDELKQVTTLLKDYSNLLKELETITASSGNPSLSNDMFVNMQKVGENLVTGLVQGVESKSPEFRNNVDTLVKDINKTLETNLSSSKTIQYGRTAVQGIQQGIQQSQNLVINASRTLANGALQQFQQYLNQSKGQQYGREIAQGIANGVNQNSYSLTSAMDDIGRQLSRGLQNIISDLQRQAAANPITITIQAQTTPYTANTRSGGYTGRRFATGGVVSSPTFGLMGEYPGASSNPEIIAPQKTLIESVQEANGPGMAQAVALLARIAMATENNEGFTLQIGDEEIARASNSGNQKLDRVTGRGN